MIKLVLMRHGESEWNKANLFTGWSDVDLSAKGIEEAKDGGNILKQAGYDFDVCYTSYLKRAIHTLQYVLDEMDLNWLPVIKTWRLNERHYGALQGLNKKETAMKYGEDQVKIWRRSFRILPPSLSADDERSPRKMEMYRDVKEKLPLAESLEITIDRCIPYYEEYIKKDMQNNKRVLIVAHGNSIRALVKYFDHLSDDEILDVNIPTAIPLVYEFDDCFNVIKRYYLGDETLIADKVNRSANYSK